MPEVRVFFQRLGQVAKLQFMQRSSGVVACQADITSITITSLSLCEYDYPSFPLCFNMVACVWWYLWCVKYGAVYLCCTWSYVWCYRLGANPINCTRRFYPFVSLAIIKHHCCVCTAGFLCLFFASFPLISIQTFLCGLTRDLKSPGRFVSIFYSPALHKQI